MAKVISRSTVKPVSSKGQSQTLNLTSWDLQFLLSGAIQKGLLFRTPHISLQDSCQSIVHRLQTSLSQTLDIFYPLAGRLSSVKNSDDDTVSFFLDCNNAGVEFVHAVADSVTVSDILDPVYSPSSIINSFFTLNDTVNIECCSKPFVGVQVTQLVDGFFVGCTFSHLIADGSTFWQFLTAWSEINGSHPGSNFLGNNPPMLERYFLENAECPVRLPALPDKPQSALKSSVGALTWRERVFHFSKENIAALKAKANTEMGTNKISSLQALLAHIWRSVTRNRRINPEDEVGFVIVTGDRPRVKPPLPTEYLGNAVRLAKVSLTAREVAQKGLGYVALQIHKTIAASQNEQVIREFLENPKLCNADRSLFSNASIVSSSPRFKVYGVDFGWGRAVAVRSGSGPKLDGKVTVFTGSEEGSIDIEACYSLATLEGMAKDVEFMDVVTSFKSL